MSGATLVGSTDRGFAGQLYNAVFQTIFHRFIMSQSSLNFTTSEPEYEIPTPKTPQRNCMRDDQLKVQTLYLYAGWSKDDARGGYTKY